MHSFNFMKLSWVLSNYLGLLIFRLQINALINKAFDYIHAQVNNTSTVIENTKRNTSRSFFTKYLLVLSGSKVHASKPSDMWELSSMAMKSFRNGNTMKYIMNLIQRQGQQM